MLNIYHTLASFSQILVTSLIALLSQPGTSHTGIKISTLSPTDKHGCYLFISIWGYASFQWIKAWIILSPKAKDRRVKRRLCIQIKKQHSLPLLYILTRSDFIGKTPEFGVRSWRGKREGVGRDKWVQQQSLTKCFYLFYIKYVFIYYKFIHLFYKTHLYLILYIIAYQISHPIQESTVPPRRFSYPALLASSPSAIRVSCALKNKYGEIFSCQMPRSSDSLRTPGFGLIPPPHWMIHPWPITWGGC